MKFGIFFLLLNIWIVPVALAETSKLNFDSALSQILSRSTDISIQEANLNRTLKKNLPARLAFLPSLSLDSKQPIGPTNFFAVPRQISLTAEMNLFRFGADLQGIYAADADEENQKNLLKASFIDVERKGVAALLNEIQRVKEVEIHTQIVKTRTESLRVSEQRYNRGYLALQEYQKLIVDLENAKARLVNAEIQESITRATLEALLGHSDIEAVWPWKNLILSPQASELTHQPLALSQSELSQRPDWEAARSQVAAESHRLSRSRRLLFPSLDTTFSYGNYQGFFGSVTAWTGALTLTFPLFDRLVGYSNSAVQAHTLQASESYLEQIKRNAHADWESSRQTFENSIRSARSREKVLTLSRKLYEDGFRRFQAGRISVNDLEIDQTRVFDSELLAIEGWSTAHLTYTKLCHALGRRLKDCLESTSPVAR